MKAPKTESQQNALTTTGGNQSLDAREIEKAYARGAQKGSKMARALETIANELEKDPAALARVMQHWMRQS